jgi:hypothetical protein
VPQKLPQKRRSIGILQFREHSDVKLSNQDALPEHFADPAVKPRVKGNIPCTQFISGGR